VVTFKHLTKMLISCYLRTLRQKVISIALLLYPSFGLALSVAKHCQTVVGIQNRHLNSTF